MNIKTILVFVTVILLSGCIGDTTVETQDTLINDGIDVKILDNSLADSYYEGDPFNIEVQIDNIGDYVIPENSFYLTLTGFNPTSFGKTTEDLKLSNSASLDSIFDTNNQSIISGY